MPACKNSWDLIRAGKTPIPKLRLNEEWAAAGLKMFQERRVADIPGAPLMGEVGGPWFFDIVRALFGTYDPVTISRMIREFFVLVPKKNGKTAYAAILMLTALLMNQRPNADFLLIGPRKEVSSRAFRNIENAIRVEASMAELRGEPLHIGTLLKVTGHTQTITHLDTGASLRVKAASPDVVQGVVPAGVLIDESHQFIANSRSDNVYTQLRGGLQSYPEAFLMQITTQSSDPPEGAFLAELDRARSVRDGTAEKELLDTSLSVMYELPPKLQEKREWEDEKVWPLLNPNMGRSVHMEGLRREFQAAKGATVSSKLPAFISQHFNVQIDSTTAATRWEAADVWNQGKCEFELNPEVIADRCSAVVVGIDSGGYYDLMALSVLGREKKTRRYLHWGIAWMHQEGMDNYPGVGRAVQPFIDSGEIVLVERGDTKTDLEQIAAIVKPLIPRMPKYGVVADKFRELEFKEPLIALGVPDERTAAMSMGAYQTGMIYGINRKLRDGTFVHAGQGHMRWAVNNVRVEPVGTAGVRATKMAAVGKIDPVTAMLAATEGLSKQEDGYMSKLSGRELRVVNWGGLD